MQNRFFLDANIKVQTTAEDSIYKLNKFLSDPISLAIKNILKYFHRESYTI